MPRAAGDARDVFHFKEVQEEGRGDGAKNESIYLHVGWVVWLGHLFPAHLSW